MATAADSSSYPSGHSSSFSGNPRNLSSPWSHIVHGERGESLSPAAPLSPPLTSDQSLPKIASSDTPAAVCAGDGPEAPAPPPPANVVEQEINSAWKTVSSGSSSAGSVIWAESWPALSEAIKIPPKSSSSDSLKALANGSGSNPTAPVTKSPKLTAANSNPISAGNNSASMRHKGMKRLSAGISSNIPINNAGGNGVGIISTSARPALAEPANNAPDKTPASGSSHVDVDHGPRTGGSEHSRHISGNRRGNSGGNGGQHQNNSGNRGSHEWNTRSFNNGRDIHTQNQHYLQQRGLSRPFLRPQAAGPAPFIPPPPQMRPFGTPIGYHEISPPVFYMPPPLPFVPQAPLYFALPDLQLRNMLLQQIEYYFSPENLCRDVFLRQNMDEEGWVPVSLVSSFRRVISLTNSIPLILDSVRGSMIVEVQGDKMRRRNDWRNWPPLAQSASPRNHAGNSNEDHLVSQLAHVGLEEVNYGGEPSGSSKSGELNGQRSDDGDNSTRSSRTQQVLLSTDNSEAI